MKIFKAFWQRLKESNTFKAALAQIATAAGAYFMGSINTEALAGAVFFALVQFVQREFKLKKPE